MEVVDGHAGGFTDVEGEPVAGLVHALRAAHLASEGEEGGQGLGVARLDLAGVGDVFAGDDEDVHGRAGVDIADSEGVLVFGDPLDGDVARSHVAEEAVGHGRILAGGERAANATA